MLFEKHIENEPSMAERAREVIEEETKSDEEEGEDDFFSDERTREHQTDRVKQKT
jgi:hypothetical protein